MFMNMKFEWNTFFLAGKIILGYFSVLVLFLTSVNCYQAVIETVRTAFLFCFFSFAVAEKLYVLHF